MIEEALNLIVDSKIAYQVWFSLEEQLLSATQEKEALLKNMLMSLKKGSLNMEEYLVNSDKFMTIYLLLTN